MAKRILSGDWHFGEAGNSPRHNMELLDFIRFLVSYAKEKGIKKFTHLGDYFHYRDRLDNRTLNYGVEGARMLAEWFEECDFLKGNHDLFYLDRRDVCSLAAIEEIVNVIDFYEVRGDKMFVSWICNGEEYDEIVNKSKEAGIRFMFGHFEFSNFQMNDHYVMEHGQTHKALSHVERVITGHYHMRQEKDNVIYAGSPFPFNFNDANDFERGFLVLDEDTGEIEWVNYDKIKIVSVSHEDFLKDTYNFDPNNTSLRVVIEDVVEDAVLDAIQSKLESLNYRDTKVQYKGNRNRVIMEAESTVPDDILNVDSAIINHLTNMTEVPGIDREMLVSLYKDSIEDQSC